MGQQNREGIVPGCDRKSRQSDPSDHRCRLFWGRQAFDPSGIQIHHKPDHRHGFIVQPPDAKPANLELACYRCGWPHQHAAMRELEMHSVVADEPGETQRAGRSRLHQGQRQT